MAWSNAELLGKMSEERFEAVYGACSRKIRNMVEGIYCKKKKKGRKVSLKAARAARNTSAEVRAGIVAAGDDSVADEIMKTWLYGKRPLLKAALDFFEIENDDGLTESDLDALEKADVAKLQELFATLKNAGFEPEEIAIYLAYMKPENFEQVPELMAVFE